MDWARIKLGLFDHVKWLRLSPLQRGAWIELWGFASKQDGLLPGGREQAAILLSRAGFPDASALVEALISGELLDEQAAALVFHDWAEHQAVKWHRGPSDEPESKAARNRRNYQDRKADREAREAHDAEVIHIADLQPDHVSSDVQRPSASDQRQEVEVEVELEPSSGTSYPPRAHGARARDPGKERREMLQWSAMEGLPHLSDPIVRSLEGRTGLSILTGGRWLTKIDQFAERNGEAQTSRLIDGLKGRLSWRQIAFALENTESVPEIEPARPPRHTVEPEDLRGLYDLMDTFGGFEVRRAAQLVAATVSPDDPGLFRNAVLTDLTSRGITALRTEVEHG